MLSFLRKKHDDLIKLNIGCGADYREGFVNIDGSKSLSKVDKVIELGIEPLTKHFHPNSVGCILANDIIEHLYHWEATKVLREFYEILSNSGQIEIKVPDCLHIIESKEYSIERKLNMLYGGQDIPQGVNAEMDESRKIFPQFFCHKYGWTMDSLSTELRGIGFKSIECERANTNFIAHASKQDV